MTVKSSLPEWNSPSDAFDSLFQFATCIDSPHYFEFLSRNPYYQQAFNTTMGMSFRRRGKGWFDIFPVADRLRVPSDVDPLLVDIGGSQGGNLLKFKAQFPTLKGSSSCKICPQCHDFFQGQPVKNAKTYFMRTGLHDWPDKLAAQILGRVRDSMGPGSVLLVHEIMLPESGVLLSSVLSDM
ncbi:hypothetical protein N7466_003886 [Penicillium verhagenii]|uniref:uncharacterized protein n=1 Tax=Penicillium verhagenii TaxID=1562060 RepID=UPI0025455E80|nr:uncharacterized protein N7466_003886 [Penicillium verhagenii]KAJ5934339.1 hypothetical protein N7466_003886 [Penicillium verhagenii]